MPRALPTAALMLLLAALPAGAQETCNGTIRFQQLDMWTTPAGRVQVSALFENTGQAVRRFTVIRAPVPGLAGTTPVGPYVVWPGGTVRVQIGTTPGGTPLQAETVRVAISLSCGG